MRKFLMPIALAACVILATAGSCKDDYNEKRGRGDAPVGEVRDEEVDVIQFPDQFSNVATTCDGNGFRLYMTTAGDFVGIIADEKCN